jgi:hypothetical protein
MAGTVALNVLRQSVDAKSGGIQRACAAPDLLGGANHSMNQDSYALARLQFNAVTQNSSAMPGL